MGPSRFLLDVALGLLWVCKWIVPPVLIYCGGVYLLGRLFQNLVVVLIIITFALLVLGIIGVCVREYRNMP